MAVDLSLWQWGVASIAVPVGIGLGSAYIGYRFSLKKTKVEARLAARRATYEDLLPAVADLVASDAAAVSLAYHEFRSQEQEDRARSARESAYETRTAALQTIDHVVVRGQLAASKPVLAALETLREDMEDTRSAFQNDAIDYPEALEANLAASRLALAAIRKVIDEES